MRVFFTSDIDWASELVIKDTIDLFETYNIKCTFFVTHKSQILSDCDRSLFEIGIHPNFNENLISGHGMPAKDIVSNLMSLYPEAIGVRSHSLTSSSPLLEIFKSFDLKYDSNQFIPYSKSIKPYKCWNGMTRIPYNFEDDVHYTYNKSYDTSLFNDFINSEYLILDFHPINIYLNTEIAATYLKAKPFSNSENLIKYRNVKTFGTRDLLLRTFVEIQNKEMKTQNLKDLIL